MKGWVDLVGWLHTEIKCRLREWNPDTSLIPVLTGLDVDLDSAVQLNWVNLLVWAVVVKWLGILAVVAGWLALSNWAVIGLAVLARC